MVPLSVGACPVYPAGVPPVTVAFSVVDSEVVIDVGDAVTEVLLVNAVSQFVSRL
jgi:hypothetical protein